MVSQKLEMLSLNKHNLVKLKFLCKKHYQMGIF